MPDGCRTRSGAAPAQCADEAEEGVEQEAAAGEEEEKGIDNDTELEEEEQKEGEDEDMEKGEGGVREEDIMEDGEVEQMDSPDLKPDMQEGEEAIGEGEVEAEG